VAVAAAASIELENYPKSYMGLNDTIDKGGFPFAKLGKLGRKLHFYFTLRLHASRLMFEGTQDLFPQLNYSALRKKYICKVKSFL